MSDASNHKAAAKDPEDRGNEPMKRNDHPTKDLAAENVEGRDVGPAGTDAVLIKDRAVRDIEHVNKGVTGNNADLTIATVDAGTAGGRPSAGEEFGMFLYMLLYRLVEVISSLSVRFKIAGTLVVILALTVVSLGYVTFSRQKNMLEQEMKSRAQVLVQQLANVGKEGLLTKQELPVFSTIADIQKNSGVAYAMVIDMKGKVFVHSELSKKDAQMLDTTALHTLRADALLFQQTNYEGEPVMDAALPIIIKAKNLRIGTARIGLSMKALNEAVYRQKVLFLWVATAFSAIGLAISFGLAKILTKPLLTLAEAMQTVARGDVSMQIKVRHRDEIGRLTEVFNQMILSLREKLHMEKYLSGSAVKSIKKHRDAAHLMLGGETKHVTALFSDVRGFTAMSEKMTPAEVVRHLNIYLNLQAKVIHQWGGIVDKFVGDEVMAIFEGEGEEVNAARAAVEIQHYCRTLNEARSAAGEQQIHIGIGLNSGDAVMGNMGSEDHMDYTVIGDTINTAARLCSVALAGQIVASKTIADQIGNMSTLNKLDPVMVKGKDKPIDIHEVIDVRGAARREMRHAADVMVEYQLAGLADDKSRAVAKDLSSWGCMLEVATPIGIGSRLTVNIDLQTLGNITVSGTVHHIRKTDSRYLIGVHFLDIQDSLRYRIVEWVHQVESETHKIDSGVTGIV